MLFLKKTPKVQNQSKKGIKGFRVCSASDYGSGIL